MTFRVRFYTLFFFLLFILSSKTFPSSHILEEDKSSIWIRQNSLHYIDEHIRILQSERLIPDIFHIAEQRKPVDIGQQKYFGTDENGKHIDPNLNPNLNPNYGKAYRYQQPMAVRFGMKVGF